MIQLTPEQQRELQLAVWPPEVHNPCTAETFVLIHKEMFERVRTVLEKEDEIADVREMYPLVNAVLDESEKDASKECA
jgi:hypothetical protein